MTKKNRCNCKNSDSEKDSLFTVYCRDCNAYIQDDIISEYQDSVKVNHFEVTCEFKDDINSYMVYMEWLDGSNFQFLGSVNSIQEWEQLKSSIKLLK